MTISPREAAQQALALAESNGGDYGVGINVNSDKAYVQWVRQADGEVDLEVGICGDQPALSAAVRARGFEPSEMDFADVDHLVRTENLGLEEHLAYVEDLLLLLGADGTVELQVYP